MEEATSRDFMNCFEDAFRELALAKESRTNAESHQERLDTERKFNAGSLQCLWESVPTVPGLPPGTVDWIRGNNPDGVVFGDSQIKETSQMLNVFCDVGAKVINRVEDIRKLNNLRKSAKIVLVLSVMKDSRSYLDQFNKKGWNDSAMPFGYNDLLTIMEDSGKAKMFAAQQYRVEERSWPEGAHVTCHEYEPLRLVFICQLSKIGYYGSVDKVQDIATREIYARKTQTAVPGAKQHWSNEVKALNDISAASNEHHIVACVKTYQRGADEFGCLIRPAADGNLHEVLQYYANNATGDKRALGMALLRAFGCLSLGLWYLHQIVQRRHRDIKPQNILYHENRVPKPGMAEKEEFLWADFGLSYDFKPHAVSSTRRPTSLGTEEYSAPETGLEEAHGRATDIFSFGCTLLEMLNVLTLQRASNPDEQWLTQFQPYKSNIRALKRWIEVRRNNLRKEEAHLGRIFAIAARMINLDPKERPDIVKVIQSLKKIADGSGKKMFCTRCESLLQKNWK